MTTENIDTSKACGEIEPPFWMHKSNELHPQFGMPSLRDLFAIAVLPVFAAYVDNAEEAGQRAYRFADGAVKARGNG